MFYLFLLFIDFMITHKKDFISDLDCYVTKQCTRETSFTNCKNVKKMEKVDKGYGFQISDLIHLKYACIQIIIA